MSNVKTALSAPPLRIDRKVFSKSPEEKLEAKKIIAAHRRELVRAGLSPKRHLNVPSGR